MGAVRIVGFRPCVPKQILLSDSVDAIEMIASTQGIKWGIFHVYLLHDTNSTPHVALAKITYVSVLTAYRIAPFMRGFLARLARHLRVHGQQYISTPQLDHDILAAPFSLG